MNAAQWNTLYPIGTDVFLIEGGVTGEDLEEVHTRTVSAAWDPLHCDTLVELEGVEGPRLLNRVRPVTPKPKHLLQQPFGLLEKMRLSEALDMMASHGVAKVASVFSSQDDEPVFAVVMLTGDRVQDYLDAFDAIDDDNLWCGTADTAEAHSPAANSSVEWKDAEAIADLPEVDSLLCNFSHDSTRDNATVLVQTIMEAVRAATPDEQAVAGPGTHK
ncbi:hypothetical protein BN2364_1084 [Alloalcanivorax xenomutans]|uniref:hypothetical protein n=1 Tax=Alloalcanivorax xenomutans TaxID=1094342 RepID=UPI0006D5B8AA|nr:hypothetical protein [Alloalcanivorax xenomutans]CUR45525.1 hypothetical protein BN2364_1084 [Alloalcanivorax xenomutans]